MNCKWEYSDREKYLEYAKRTKQKYRNRTGSFLYHSKYNDEDDKMILEHKISDRELSQIIKHSVTSIQNHRNKLKKEITNNEYS